MSEEIRAKILQGEEIATKYLDDYFTALQSEVGERGEPDGYIVIKVSQATKAVEGPPLAIFRTKEGIYKRFPALAQWHAGNEYGVSVAAWWFDD